MNYLLALGIDLSSLGAVPIRRLRLGSGKAQSEVILPFCASSLSRRTLDERLLQRSAETGAKVFRGSRVQRLESFGDGHFMATLSDGRVVEAHHAVLATGKYDLRCWERAKGKQNDLLGFKMHWRLSRESMSRLGDCVELIFFPSGYCGLQQVEDGWANLCLVVRRESFLKQYLRWELLLKQICSGSPALASYLLDAQPRWKTPLAISQMPYGYVCHEDQRIWRIGDQVAVIPSFCGSGISIALHSALLAADAIINKKPQEAYYRSVRRDLLKKVSVATLLSRSIIGRLGSTAIINAARWFPGAVTGVARATRI
jgi:flavin-dependent dehydrogenase